MAGGSEVLNGVTGEFVKFGWGDQGFRVSEVSNALESWMEVWVFRHLPVKVLQLIHGNRSRDLVNHESHLRIDFIPADQSCLNKGG